MVTREDMIDQSVTDYVRAGLQSRGYDEPDVKIVEAFPYTIEKLDRQLVALGFNFDDEGEQAELGSDLKRRVYTIEFFVFGTTLTWARNLANAIKFACDVDGRIPLKDVSQDPAPVIDHMLVNGIRTQRQVVPDPEPWQEFVYLTTVEVQDEYFAALV